MRVGGSSRVFCLFGLLALLLTVLASNASALPAEPDKSKIDLREYLPGTLPKYLPLDAWSAATKSNITQKRPQEFLQTWSAAGGREHITDHVLLETADDGQGDLIVMERTLQGRGTRRVLTVETHLVKHPEETLVGISHLTNNSLGPDHLDAWLLEGEFAGPVPHLGYIIVASEFGKLVGTKKKDKAQGLSSLGRRIAKAINDGIRQEHGLQQRNAAKYQCRSGQEVDSAACSGELHLVPKGAAHMIGRAARPFVLQLKPALNKLRLAKQRDRESGG